MSVQAAVTYFSLDSLYLRLRSPHLRALLPAFAGGTFVNGPRKTNATFGVACFSFGLIISQYLHSGSLFFLESSLNISYSANTTILVTVQPCAGLNEKVCCKLACISTFSSKSAYGGTTKLLVFMNMKTRRCNG